MWDSLSSSSGTQDGRGYFDGSGWTVSTGSSTKASGGDRVQTNADPATTSTPAVVIGGSTMSMTTVALIAGAAVLLIVLLKKKRK